MHRDLPFHRGTDVNLLGTKYGNARVSAQPIAGVRRAVCAQRIGPPQNTATPAYRRSRYAGVMRAYLRRRVAADSPKGEPQGPADGRPKASAETRDPHVSTDNHPLTEPAVRPPTRCFWSAKKSAMMGMDTRIAPAAK